jgi:hypothetical protein
VISSPRLREIASLLTLWAACLLIFCIHYSCWSPADLQRPWFILEDVPLLSGYFQAVAEGDRLPFGIHLIERLNAPFQANWSDFPTTEELLYLYGGLLTRIGGIVWAYNMCLLTAHLLAGSGFYLAARLLGAARIWAVLGGVAFASSRYLFVRDTVHINLSFCWLLPLYWVAARWVWEQAALSRKQIAGLVAIAFVASWLHPYYWYFWMVMLAPSLLKQPKRAFALCAMSIVFLLAAQVDTLRGWSAYGRSGVAWERTLNELQLYQLRLPELMLPLEHRWESLRNFARVHYYNPMAGYGAEMDSSYAGMLGLIAIGWMLAVSLRRIVQGRPPEWEFGFTLWVLAVALGGGLNMVAGSFGLLLFRCSCRFSVLLLAGFLLYLVCRLSLLRWKMPLQVAVLAVTLPLLFWDQTPSKPGSDHYEKMAAYVANEREMTGYLESHLPPNSMVFQWPWTGYPETPPLLKLAHYEQMTGWFFSKTLRWSYGDCRGRPESQWQLRLRTQSPETILERVQSFGFGALALYTRGMTAQELQAWRPPDWKSSQGDRWVYLLRPPAQPALPEREPCFFFDRSFYPLEKNEQESWRWASGPGRIELLLPNPCPFVFRLGLTAYGEDRQCTVTLDGKPVFQGRIRTGHENITPVEIDLSALSAGNHRMYIDVDGYFSLSDEKRQLAFQVRNARMDHK